MKRFTAAIATVLTSFFVGSGAQAQQPAPAPARGPSSPVQQEVVPALADYTDDVLFGDIWLRKQITPRERSMVTLSALIAGNNTAQLTNHLARALDNGVTPLEVSGIITQLAFYVGWPKAVSAVLVAKDVYDKRGIKAPPAADVRAAVGGPKITTRAEDVVPGIGAAAPPRLESLTNDVIFDNLWRRTDLKPRDRSLVTIAALITNGATPDQLTFYIKKGMDDGLSQVEISEIITHLSFYAGWQKATAAVPVARGVFATRKGAR